MGSVRFQVLCLPTVPWPELRERFVRLEALGLESAALPDHFVERMVALWRARGTAQLPDFTVAAFTFALLVGLPKFTKRVPAPLFAIASASAFAMLLHR